MEFKVGDIVMVKGTIVENLSNLSNHAYPLKFKSIDGLLTFSLTKEGEYQKETGVVIELIERPKKKVVKYKVLYNFNNSIEVTENYYKSKEDFVNNLTSLKFMQLLESTAKEFEE